MIFGVLFSILLLQPMTHAQQPSIKYILGMSRPSTHLFEIEVTFSNLPPGDAILDLVLPVWRSGRYVVFDFAGGVHDFAAEANGKPLKWHKIDKTTWRVEKRGTSQVTARYRMFANEFRMRTKGLNDEHGFVDPMTAFMYVEKYRKLPLEVTVIPFSSWRVTTGLDPVKGSLNTFSAPSYDYFADCPIEIGPQREWEFTIDGKKHVLMISGEGNYDPDRIVKDLTKIVKVHKEFWGRLPYERYYFMVHTMANPSGATEHINSNIYNVRPFIFQNAETYAGFLATEIHEHFHTWNVKQLRPKGLNPYTFYKENYTEELGIAEGTTEYYEEVLTARLGFRPTPIFLDRLATKIREDRERPGNLRQSLAESSFDAWVKYWKNTEEAINYESHYYYKGANVSLLLDFEIRQRSKNTHSLDHVMRAMFERFPLSGSGYTLSDFRKVAEEFAGGSLKEFFDDYVYGTKPLDWERYLSYAGLKISAKESSLKPWLGITVTGERLRVSRVYAGSPAYEAGVNVGDEVVALDGYRAISSFLNTRPAEMQEGSRVRLTVFRDGRLRDIEITLKNRPVPSYTITRVEDPTELQISIYQDWLKTEW